MVRLSVPKLESEWNSKSNQSKDSKSTFKANESGDRVTLVRQYPSFYLDPRARRF
jgi:hypothetical protein